MISWLRRLFVAALFLALALVSMIVFLTISAPKMRPEKSPPFEDYDSRPMLAAMQTNVVSAQLETISKFGSRFMGQPGFYATEDYLRREFTAAGLEMHELENVTLAPQTVHREIRNADGQPLAGVEIFPLFPNYLQPMVTPPQGLSGELVLLDDATLLTRTNFNGCIGLINIGNPSQSYGANWERYAQLGVRALIVAHPGGFTAIADDAWQTLPKQMVSHDPINYVRLAASGPIFNYTNQVITLSVRTEFRTIRHRTLVGVLRANQKTADALVVASDYDAYSLLPDRAPGTLQACSVATQLAILKGLRPYRDTLRRDVIFISCGARMMANDGEVQLLTALGPHLDREAAALRLRAAQPVNEAQLQQVARIATLTERPEFLTDRSQTAALVGALDADTRAVLDEQLRYVLNTVVLERSEQTLQDKLVFLREGGRNLDGRAYKDYLASKGRYDQAFSAAGYNVNRLLEARREFVDQYQIRQRMINRFQELLAHHQFRQQQLAQRLALNDLFRGYRTIVAMASELAPRAAAASTEQVTFYMGKAVDEQLDGPTLNNLMVDAVQRSNLGGQTTFFSYTRNHSDEVAAFIATPDAEKPPGKEIPVGATVWNRFSYPAFAVVNTDRKDSYAGYSYPVDKPYMHDVASLRGSLQMLGELTLSLAYGNGQFHEPRKIENLTAYRGKVFVPGIGDSIVPTYPLKGAVVSGGYAPQCQFPGYLRYLLIPTDPYGQYDLSYSPASFNPNSYNDDRFKLDMNRFYYSPVAVGYGADGKVAYVKDNGPAAQNIYRSSNLACEVAVAGISEVPTHLVAFRAAPVSILDLINPQTMRPFSSAEFVSTASLTEFSQFSSFETAGPMTTFLSPDERFYVKLKAGTVESELVQTTRAVLLGPPGEEKNNPTAEITGAGYLVADKPFLLRIPAETARSMLSLNGNRVAALENHNMADERTAEFQKQAAQLFAASQEPKLALHASALLAGDSATYSILNYPVIRNTIFDAVYGILWYLGLLVPFAFFFEKLVCGYSDIRKQILANAIIFLTVFALLKFLHPAFAMIRSSLMILLGFIILLISLGVILLLSGRFQENLEALRRKRGQVSAAEVNKMGVLGTAFALGLNNMHRRKVRTGLTCATLVLITFAMLCFTTLQSSIVDSAAATGKAPYQGLLVKPAMFFPILPAELFAIDVKYGHRYQVSPRAMYVGRQTWDRETFNPRLNIVGDVNGEAHKELFDSILLFAPNEPMASQFKFIATRGWWTDADLKQPDAPLPVMIPDDMAHKLGITPEMVMTGNPVVQVNGTTFTVRGIFDADVFGTTKDIDGLNFLPFDVTALTNLRTTEPTKYEEVIAEDDEPRIDPHRVILAPNVNLNLSVQDGLLRTVSIAVVMDHLNYKEAQAEISRYLEQTGKPTYYGLDGISYLGKRYRETSMAGLLDLIIPLFIASITVLNTMRGSVYERRDEIFVYNAVGIAPRHIFFMFMAEALVYSVVGTVLGYLLAQGTGTVLTALNWTGGVQMNFTSKLTIYVSLTIIIATLVSTYFPARSATAIAAPAEESGWKLPEPEGDTLAFNLPFTFRYHGRVAILAFFHRYLQDHGEGSAGSFFASPPQLGVHDHDGACVPQITTTIWLKPFDLGVSQQMTIDLLPDPETKENIARITLQRQSGTKEAWLRLNYSFVSKIRKHFLHWRAVPQDQREELFAEAKQLLVESTESHAPASA